MYGHYRPYFWSMLTGCFFLPFVAFLFAAVKRSLFAMCVVALAINLGIWTNKYLMIVPVFSPDDRPFDHDDKLARQGGFVMYEYPERDDGIPSRNFIANAGAVMIVLLAIPSLFVGLFGFAGVITGQKLVAGGLGAAWGYMAVVGTYELNRRKFNWERGSKYRDQHLLAGSLAVCIGLAVGGAVHENDAGAGNRPGAFGDQAGKRRPRLENPVRDSRNSFARRDRRRHVALLEQGYRPRNP